jgi:hypothetical protein
MIREWLRVAGRRDVVVRSLKYGVIVGSILIAINHGNAIVAGEVDSTRILQMILTPLVPYVVATASSCGAILDNLRGSEQC